MVRRLTAVAVVALLAASCSADENVGNDVFVVEAPPDVDLGEHSVPLAEIVFDTFDGGSVALPDSTPELRAELLDAIPPIDRPVYGDTSAGDWLDPDDLVLGYVSESGAYAYPIKILNFHEIVNDEIDGVPVLISYCPLCRSAIVYDRRVDGQVLTFSNTSALHESDMVMVDRQTGSYWWQVLGTAIVGSLTGAQLEALPSEMATWRDWADRHPDTMLLTRETGYTRDYERDSFATYDEFLDAGNFAFPVGEAARDDRLLPSELVVTVQLDGSTVAYPVERLDGPVDDDIGGTAVRVVPHGGGANVFEVEDDGSDGAAIPARTSFWFAIVAAFPDVTVGP